MGDMSRSRSSYKVKGQIEGHNLIFDIYMCLITLHILRDEMSRSRSSFKVKGQIDDQKRAILTLVITFHLLQIAT